MWTSLILAPVLALSPLDPITEVSLRRGELARYQRSGLSRASGPHTSIVVVTARKVYIKTPDYSNTLDFSGELKASFMRMLSETTQKSLHGSPKENPMWPSAYDATDHALQLRKGRSVLTWNNRDFDYPSGPSIFTVLDGLLERTR